MSEDNIVELASREESIDPINKLLRAGTRSLIEAAIALDAILYTLRPAELDDTKRMMIIGHEGLRPYVEAV